MSKPTGFMQADVNSPFSLDNLAGYQRWRDQKLAKAATSIDELVVEIDNLSHPSEAEKSALASCLQECNMVIYACHKPVDDDKQAVRQLGREFGLERLDHNMGADDAGITELEVKDDAAHKRYIPYSNRAIRWHTDGYYNEPGQMIHGLVLHCVEPAARGGENALLDHELAYIYLREKNPQFIAALMQDDAMTIPANIVEGKVLRPDRSGPVFNTDVNGHLHMRYTERMRNVIWRDDPVLSAAIETLLELLHSKSEHIHRATLQGGQGLICNNVLHDRSGFENDQEHYRLLYRLRYYDRCSA